MIFEASLLDDFWHDVTGDWFYLDSFWDEDNPHFVDILVSW